MKDVKIHQIKIDFQVTPQVKRYVYVYLLEGNSCYLIDSGVCGCETTILKHMESVGKSPADLKGIFLTHAHPDHIGTAAWFKEHTGCKIYASAGERSWIEDIDVQFKQRPIPNFYKLAGRSVAVDAVVKDGDKIDLGRDGILEVIGTPGHSKDEVSYRLRDAVFIGDTIPVQGDIPIYIDRDASITSIKKLDGLVGASDFYPAWDQTYTYSELRAKVQEGIEIIRRIDRAVSEIIAKHPESSLENLVPMVCEALGMLWLMNNPLFSATVESHIGISTK